MDTPGVDPSDLALARRFASGRVPIGSFTRAMLLRLAWIHARLWEHTTAARRLAEGVARLPQPAEPLSLDDSRTLIDLINATDCADSARADSSAEFLWRHPELLDPGADTRRFMPPGSSPAPQNDR